MSEIFVGDLPEDVIQSIQRVLDLSTVPGGDPLDVLVKNFDPIDVLNGYFPDEASLGKISTVQAQLAKDELELQDEIERLHQELKRDQDPARMQLIQEMISELLGQMSRIREKATESEAVVRNITKEIQALDLAKKNLSLSMTTLKRLQMLANALDQLEDLAKEKQYSEISQTLAAVKEISATFQSFGSIPRISQVQRRVHEIQSEIRLHIDADFDAFYVQDPARPVKPAVIADACQVVDILGPDFRTHLVERYVGLELKEYRRIFKPAEEAGQLDNISRRFAWFRRLLQNHEVEHGRVFPSEWKVDWQLFAKFVEITKDDISTLLFKLGASLTVKNLLDNLQITTEFEATMERRWAISVQDILKKLTHPQPRSVQPISAAFEPYMNVFVDAQDKALADMLAPHRGGRSKPPRPSLDAPSAGDANEGGSPPVIVMPSSTELFYFYGQSLEQCAKLSTGRPLFDLCVIHKKWLKIYADEVLIAGMKRPPSQSRKSVETRFDPGEVKQACLIINTADYCQTTALELEDKIREKIDAEFKERVSLQFERDLFVTVISGAIVMVLRELENACESAFTTMVKTSWPQVSQVSGQSPYISDLTRSVEQTLEVAKPLVEQKKYVRNLFDKACGLILAKFTNSLVRSRPLREIGAEQLLIDLQAVRAFLTKLPGEMFSTPSYTRSLQRSTTMLETLLKVIVTPVDPPEGFILNYTLLIGDASFSNFQKVLDLKGTPKQEQNALLDSFLTITSTKTELESQSFLSSLDMEPALSGQTGGTLVSPGGTRVSLPLESVGETILTALGSPPGELIGKSGPGAALGRGGEVFSDFKRFMSFNLRRDTQSPL